MVFCCTYPTGRIFSAELEVTKKEIVNHKHEKRIYEKRLNENLSKLSNMPRRAKLKKVQAILKETREITNEYNKKCGEPDITPKSFREAIKKFQKMQLQDPSFSTSRRVLTKFRRQMVELMFHDEIQHKQKEGMSFSKRSDEELNENAGLGECLPSIVRDLGLCSVGVCMTMSPSSTIKAAGFGLIVNAGDRIACTLYNNFYYDQQQVEEENKNESYIIIKKN